MLLVLAVAVAYGNIIFLGQTLVPSANYHPFDDSAEHLRPAPVSAAPFINWYDQGANWWQAEPAAKFFSHRYRRGDIPFWDPTIAAGSNAHVNVTQAQYFPPYVVLMLAGDPPVLRDVYYLVMILISGLATFALVKGNGGSSLASATAGIAFALSGTITLNANSVPGQSYAMVPVMVWAADWALRRRDAASLAIAPILIGLGTLSSFLPVAISGYVLIGFLFLAHVVVLPDGTDQRARLSHRALTFGVFVAIVALSILLCGFLLVPFSIAANEASTFQEWYTGLGLQHFNPDQLLTLVSPRISYDVNQAGPGEEIFPGKTASASAFFWIGIIPLLLVFISKPASRAAWRLFVFAASGGAFVLMKMLGVPPVQWLGYIPPFDKIHFIPYFCSALTLCVAALAAIALDAFTKARPSGRRLAVLIVAATFLFILIIDFALIHGPIAPEKRGRYAVEIAVLAGSTAGLILLVALRKWGRIAGSKAAVAVILLVSAQLVWHTFRPRYYRADVWSDPPRYVRFLAEDGALFRIHSVNDISLTANVFQGLGLSGVSSRHVFHSPRYETLVRALFDVPTTHFLLPSTLLPANRDSLDLLNVKYLITRDSTDALRLERAGFEGALQDGRYLIYRNPQVWPRAFLTASYALAEGPKEALDRVVTMRGGPQLVLEARPINAPGRASGIDDGIGTVRVIQYTPDRVEFEVSAAEPSLLVFLDNHAEGWRAEVGGLPAQLLHANYAFRAVEVPEGNSRVVFSYRPPGLLAGTAVSFGGGAICVFLLAVAVWRSRRQQSTSAHEGQVG